VSFIVLPALMPSLAQTTLRGTQNDKFKYVTREIAKQLTKPWPGEVYAAPS
jgi:hypothetical protein